VKRKDAYSLNVKIYARQEGEETNFPYIMRTIQNLECGEYVSHAFSNLFPHL
jgi:hypothetical protein